MITFYTWIVDAVVCIHSSYDNSAIWCMTYVSPSGCVTCHLPSIVEHSDSFTTTRSNVIQNKVNPSTLYSGPCKVICIMSVKKISEKQETLWHTWCKKYLKDKKYFDIKTLYTKCCCRQSVEMICWPEWLSIQKWWLEIMLIINRKYFVI